MKNKIFFLLMAASFLAALSPAFVARGAEIRDELGRSISLSGRPQRIVALTPSLVEILFALGLGGRIVGATTWADHPPPALKLPRVGSYVSPNLERIVALAPDLVLANREGNPPWVVEKLSRTGIPVFVTWPKDPARLPASIAKLGGLCGESQRGREVAASMNRDFSWIKERLRSTEPVPVLLVIGSRPLVSVSPDSFSGKLLAMAGGRNIVPSGRGQWPRISMEYVVQSAPRVVVVSTMERGQNLAREVELWRAMPGLKDNPGYRVVHLASDLIDRPGPRLIQGLRKLARLLHPERFPAGGGQP